MLVSEALRADLMLASVAFGSDRHGFDIPDGKLVGVWDGPASLPEDELARQFRADLEDPLDFPPLRRAAVPGDRVVLAVDADLPRVALLLPILVESLRE